MCLPGGDAKCHTGNGTMGRTEWNKSYSISCVCIPNRYFVREIRRFIVFKIIISQSLLGDEDALSLAMDDNDPESVDEFGSGYRGFSAQSSAIRDATAILLNSP